MGYLAAVLEMIPKNMIIFVLLSVQFLVQLVDCQKCGRVAENRSCPAEMCCSGSGWCGETLEHCRSQGCQRQFGRCSPFDFNPSTGLILGSGSCGLGPADGAECSVEGSCCSEHGWCGKEEAHCGTGCQPFFGKCIKLVESRCQWPSSPSPELAIFPSQPFKNNQSNQHFQLCKRGFLARDPKASSIPVTCLSNGLWPTAIPNACVNNMNFNKKVKFVKSNVLVDELTDGRPLTCTNISQPLEIPLEPTTKIQDIRILFSKSNRDYAFSISIDDVNTKTNTLTNKYRRIFNERVDEKTKVVFPINNLGIADNAPHISRRIRLAPINEMRICEIECAISTDEDVVEAKSRYAVMIIIGLSVVICFLLIALVLYICLRRSNYKRWFFRDDHLRRPPNLPTSPFEILNSNNRAQSWFDDNLYEEVDLPDLPPSAHILPMSGGFLNKRAVSTTKNNYSNTNSSNSPALNPITHPMPPKTLPK